MPFSDASTLKIFLSYSSEDLEIARALAKGLREAFSAAIEITFADEFASGINWRKQIDSSLEATDIIIVVATGRLKPGFSFTGYEIGYISHSIKERPNMINYPNLERRIIPFAVLAAVPATVDDMEGININPADLRVIRFEAEGQVLDAPLQSGGQGSAPYSDVVKLLDDIDTLMKRMLSHAEIKETREQGHERFLFLRRVAHDVWLRVLEAMRGRTQSERCPQSKLVVRLQPTASDSPEHDLFRNVTLEMIGPCFEIFGFDEAVRHPLTWAQFAAHADHNEIEYAWRAAIGSLVVTARKGQFDDNTVIISADKKSSYRIFAAKVVKYYSGVTEVELYLVRTLNKKIYGDRRTSLLLRAAEIGLQYRFLFLENGVNFSPANMKITPLQEIKPKVLDLLNELNLLLNLADEFGLNQSEAVIEIMGEQSIDQISGFMDLWQEQKDRLYSAANILLSATDNLDLAAKKKEFIAVLDAFSRETTEMNREYTARVLRGLEAIICPRGSE